MGPFALSVLAALLVAGTPRWGCARLRLPLLLGRALRAAVVVSNTSIVVNPVFQRTMGRRRVLMHTQVGVRAVARRVGGRGSMSAFHVGGVERNPRQTFQGARGRAGGASYWLEGAARLRLGPRVRVRVRLANGSAMRARPPPNITLANKR